MKKNDNYLQFAIYDIVQSIRYGRTKLGRLIIDVSVFALTLLMLPIMILLILVGLIPRILFRTVLCVIKKRGPRC